MTDIQENNKQSFNNPANYTTNDKYVSSSNVKTKDRKEGTFTDRAKDRIIEGTVQGRNSKAKSYRGKEGLDRGNQEKPHNERRRALCPLQAFYKSGRTQKGSREGSSSRTGRATEVSSSNPSIFTKLFLTLMYLDALDSHPSYAITMLRDLWGRKNYRHTFNNTGVDR